MRLIKLFVSVAMSLVMTMCHPVMAETKPAKIGEIAMATCITADHYVGVVYNMAARGRSTYEIMAYLDEVTDPSDREYLGILMAKVNVTSVQLAVRRAYTESDVVKKNRQICMDQIGKTVNRY